MQKPFLLCKIINFSIPLRTLRILVLVLVLLNTFQTTAQEDFPEYDELAVEMSVPDIGVVEMPIAIKGMDAYVSVLDLFKFLKIKAESTEEGRITGFIVRPQATYSIDPAASEIVFQGEVYPLQENDLIQSPTSLYLQTSWFGEIFGLHTEFSFRSLSVSLETDLELPIVKERKLARMRENIRQVKGEVVADTILERRYPFFRTGMLDWGVVATQQSDMENDNRFNLGLGTMLAGGEANFMLNYSSRLPFDSRNQFYQWRYVNNDSRYVNQVTAGRIATRATSSLFAPVVGIQLSNSPMQNRRSFGTYTISDYTEPQWTIELYVNNILVAFTEADASGYYSFDVPLMYGNTNVNLRFYGPWGEERIEERLINIPYNFVPKNEFEYTLSAGMVEDEDNSKYSRLDVNYGVSNGITFGGGVEYLSEVESGEIMPFLSSSVKLAPSLLFTGEYMYGVKGEGILSYRSPSSFQVDLNYIRYHEDQTAINYNYLEERKISLSAPIRSRNFTVFSRFSLNQILMPTTKFTTAQLLLSGSVFGVNTNLTTYGIYNDRSETPTVYSTLSQNYRLPYRWMLSPQVQYDFNANQLNNLILKMERQIFGNGYVNLGYENNLIRKSHIFEVGLRYTFDFAQSALSTRLGSHNTSYVQSARGSIIIDDNTGHFGFSNRSSMSKGGLTLMAFLDYNGNGKKDELEPFVPGLELKTSGRMSYNEDRTLLRVMDLQPYVDIVLEVNEESLDNIAWRVPNPRIEVQTLPNHFQRIYVPVAVLGEASGMVYFKSGNGTQGLGRIIINILDENGNKVAGVLSEGDGYFTYLGLKPGHYVAQLDHDQLEKLQFKGSPEEISFEIKVDQYGDIVDDLEFVLEKVQDNTSIPVLEGSAQLEPSEQHQEQTEERQTAKTGHQEADPIYRVQVVASNVRLSHNHPSLRNREDAEMQLHDGMYKYTIGAFPSRSEAIALMHQLRAEGFEDAFVVQFSDDTAIDSSNLPSANRQTPGEVTQAPEALLYKVQVVASNVRLSSNHPSLRKREDTEVHFHDGMYKYTIGAVSSLTEAIRLQSQLQKEGFVGAFVVAFQGEERVEF